MTDKICIGVYSVQKEEDYDVRALGGVDGIIGVYNGFKDAAEKLGKSPPSLVVSTLLIPDWEKGEDYNSYAYKVAQKKFIKDLKEKLGQAVEVEVENFYDVANDKEKGYLEGLRAKGSNADMIKTHALIANKEDSVLQIDSNTQIPDYRKFYDNTFGLQEEKKELINNHGGVVLNASFYDQDYVSVHNKAVFVLPNSTFAENLKEVHLEYCEKHADAHLLQENPEKLTKNSIYSKDFVVAANRTDLAIKGIVAANRTDLAIKGNFGQKTIYPVNMDNPCIRADLYITAVHGTWKSARTENIVENDPSKELKDLQIQFKATKIDLPSYEVAVKKLTMPLLSHGKDEKEALEKENHNHDKLLIISNIDLDKKIISTFFNEAYTYIQKTDKDIEVLNNIAKFIPDNYRGNTLTSELFKCSVKEFHATPQRYIQPEHILAALKDKAPQGVEASKLFTSPEAIEVYKAGVSFDQLKSATTYSDEFTKLTSPEAIEVYKAGVSFDQLKSDNRKGFVGKERDRRESLSKRVGGGINVGL